jgi:hypothetical protein
MLKIGDTLARVSGDGPPLMRVVGIETGSPSRYVCQGLGRLWR